MCLAQNKPYAIVLCGYCCAVWQQITSLIYNWLRLLGNSYAHSGILDIRTNVIISKCNTILMQSRFNHK